jgi:hypothetical protein
LDNTFFALALTGYFPIPLQGPTLAMAVPHDNIHALTAMMGQRMSQVAALSSHQNV